MQDLVPRGSVIPDKGLDVRLIENMHVATIQTIKLSTSVSMTDWFLGWRNTMTITQCEENERVCCNLFLTVSTFLIASTDLIAEDQHAVLYLHFTVTFPLLNLISKQISMIPSKQK